MKRVVWFVFILAAALCLSCVPTWAGVIFDDFGSGYGYDCCVGTTVSGASSVLGASFSSAMPFTAAISGDVSQIGVALGLVAGAGGATVSLWTSADGIPDVELDSWNITTTTDFGTCCGVVTISGLSGPSLTAGQVYYLAIVSDGTSWEAWNFNSAGLSGVVAGSADAGASWYPAYWTATLGAFDILSGTGPEAVPEPGTMVLLGAGLLCVLARARRRLVH